MTTLPHCAAPMPTRSDSMNLKIVMDTMLIYSNVIGWAIICDITCDSRVPHCSASPMVGWFGVFNVAGVITSAC